MCDLCDENGGEEQSCQGCGRLICFDTKSVDDVCAPAAVTSSGDLYCRPCARRHDDAEAEEDEFGYLADEFEEVDELDG